MTSPQPRAVGATTRSRVDPRLRVLAAVVFSVVVALCHRPAALGVGLAAGVAAVGLAGLRPGEVLRRLFPVELLMLLLLIVLPWTAAGPTIAIGPFDVSRQGIALAVAIAVKGNAIMLTLLGLLGTMDEIRLGHALLHLRVPDKLAHLLLFTVRYLGVLRDEHRRLTDAMRVRGFRPGMNGHTCRTYGYLVGMLLARSFDRSERIAAAMKCRGFRGRFYLLDHFVFSWIDVPFAAATVSVLAAIVLLEWT